MSRFTSRVTCHLLFVGVTQLIDNVIAAWVVLCSVEVEDTGTFVGNHKQKPHSRFVTTDGSLTQALTS